MTNKKINNAIQLGESLEYLSETYDLYTLFIDLCESTAIKQYCQENEIPDITWITRLQIFLSRTSRIIVQYGGAIVKTIGDEVMATFPVSIDPDDIIKCIIEVFQTFDTLKSYNTGKFRILSKASIDFGVCYNGQVLDVDIIDPIGTSVDRCARISKKAGANEIVYSDEVHDLLTQNNFPFKKYNISDEMFEAQGLGNIRIHKLTL